MAIVSISGGRQCRRPRHNSHEMFTILERKVCDSDEIALSSLRNWILCDARMSRDEFECKSRGFFQSKFAVAADGFICKLSTRASPEESER